MKNRINYIDVNLNLISIDKDEALEGLAAGALTSKNKIEQVIRNLRGRIAKYEKELASLKSETAQLRVKNNAELEKVQDKAIKEITDTMDTLKKYIIKLNEPDIHTNVSLNKLDLSLTNYLC